MLKLKIGTRASALALVQANWVKDKLIHHYKDCQIQLVPIKTEGDRIKKIPISQIRGKGVFIKEIEKALLEEKIDLAVHSMKDLPLELPSGLLIAAITKREDPFDVFISNSYSSLEDLPPYSTIATGSIRRKVQLLHYRNDLIIKEIRGNVITRLKKVNKGYAEGLILAAAALKRLKKRAKISQYLHPDICLPAAGQGALGIEIRSADLSLKKRLVVINDIESNSAITAEKSCLRSLGGGCHIPASAYGEIIKGEILLKGFVASLDGKLIIREKVLGPKEEAEILGELLAKKILTSGGKELIT